MIQKELESFLGAYFTLFSTLDLLTNKCDKELKNIKKQFLDTNTKINWINLKNHIERAKSNFEIILEKQYNASVTIKTDKNEILENPNSYKVADTLLLSANIFSKILLLTFNAIADCDNTKDCVIKIESFYKMLIKNWKISSDTINEFRIT